MTEATRSDRHVTGRYAAVVAVYDIDLAICPFLVTDHRGAESSGSTLRDRGPEEAYTKYNPPCCDVWRRAFDDTAGRASANKGR